MSITFSTCFYIFKSKFTSNTYTQWMNNMLSNVNNFNLVIYCDDDSYSYFHPYLNNPRIKVIIKPHTEFYNYKYKDLWIKNHKQNVSLNQLVDWKVNMLWAEKIHFVNETINNTYFETEFYGWCDIGYFRGRPNDIPSEQIANWPGSTAIETLHKNKIYYACANNDKCYISRLMSLINDKFENGLSKVCIPPNQVSIAGGFFLLHKQRIEWWRNTFDTKLRLYFDNNRLVKDDQIIIADCIFSDLSQFCIISENNVNYDRWFLFQRYLL